MRYKHWKGRGKKGEIIILEHNLTHGLLGSQTHEIM